MTCARVTVRVYGRRGRAGEGGREGVGEGGIRYFECKPTKPNEEGLQNKRVGGEDRRQPTLNMRCGERYAIQICGVYMDGLCARIDGTGVYE